MILNDNRLVPESAARLESDEVEFRRKQEEIEQQRKQTADVKRILQTHAALVNGLANSERQFNAEAETVERVFSPQNTDLELKIAFGSLASDAMWEHLLRAVAIDWARQNLPALLNSRRMALMEPLRVKLLAIEKEHEALLREYKAIQPKPIA